MKESSINNSNVINVINSEYEYLRYYIDPKIYSGYIFSNCSLGHYPENTEERIASIRDRFRFQMNEYKMLGIQLKELQPILRVASFAWCKRIIRSRNISLSECMSTDIYFCFSQPGMYIHRSNTAPGMIAYNRSPEHMVADRQLITKFGKFLNTFYFEVFNQKEIRAISELYIKRTTNSKVYFAKTREEIKHVYMNGPGSCMGGKNENHFRCTPIHPTEAYASGDFAVAYIKDDNDRITARCVVDEVNKQYVRAYGNTEIITDALNCLGYKDTRLYADGLRLLKIKFADKYMSKYNYAYIGPYIDGHERSLYEKMDDDTFIYISPENVTEDFKYLFLFHSQNSHNSAGFFDDIEDERPCCCRCERIVSEESMFSDTINRNTYYCSQCVGHYIMTVDAGYIHRDYGYHEVAPGIIYSSKIEAMRNGYSRVVDPDTGMLRWYTPVELKVMQNEALSTTNTLSTTLSTTSDVSNYYLAA